MHRPDKLVARLSRRRDIDTVKAIYVAADLERAIFLHEGVAGDFVAGGCCKRGQRCGEQRPKNTRMTKEVRVVLHCAGPYIHTSKLMVQACLRTGAHYLDPTGEIPVYEAIAAQDAQAKAQGVMLLPAVGFDMAPTDCLAVHLKRWLPSATFLTLAFQVEDPAGLPAGTQRTAIELIPYGDSVRRNGRLVAPERRVKICPVDFGSGPVQATRLTWGDVLAAYFSTGIPNIEDYAVLPKALRSWPAICDPCSGWRPCVICLNEVSGRERRPTSASAPRCMCGAKSKTRKVAARSHACTGRKVDSCGPRDRPSRLGRGY